MPGDAEHCSRVYTSGYVDLDRSSRRRRRRRSHSREVERLSAAAGGDVKREAHRDVDVWGPHHRRREGVEAPASATRGGRGRPRESSWATSAASTSASACSPEAAEESRKDVLDVGVLLLASSSSSSESSKGTSATSSTSDASFEGLHPYLIIQRPLLRVAEAIVGFVDLLELARRFLLVAAGVGVRVVLLGKAVEGALYLGLGGSPGDLENVVVVPWGL